MTLSERMGYNNDVITIWEVQTTDKKDDIGRPIKTYAKHIIKGRWEDKVKTIRKNGAEVTSTANLLISLNPLNKEFLYEKGESKKEVPSSLALKSILIEGVNRIRRETVEWIIYI